MTKTIAMIFALSALAATANTLPPTPEAPAPVVAR